MPQTDTLHATLPEATTDPQPAIRVYPPDPASANSRALVIFPGGGYGHLAEHEGKGYAEWYSKRGYTCFVVAYRLGTQGFRHPCMIEDAAAAVHAVRHKASEFGICREKIGVMGSSAGGHLAASLLVHWDTFKEPANCRPDFGILCYPVISFTEACAHIGSRNNLLGENADPELYTKLSCEKQVTPQTPPCFLWHTAEDAGVPMQNSLLFADALHRNGVGVELHVYPKGRHGLGLNTELPWAQASLRWLDEVFEAQ